MPLFSTITSSIPFALVNNIGFAAILFLVYQFLKILQEKEIIRIEASHLYNLAIFFQGFSLLQFIMLLFYPQWGASEVIESFIFLNTRINFLFQLASIEWFSIIGTLYLVVLFFLLFKVLFQFYHLSSLVRTSNFAESDSYTSFLNKLPHSSGNRKIKLGTSAAITSPISFGWVEPIILLPIALVNQLTVKELESIILHEWAHILRNDYVLNIFTTLIQVVLFFNPFSYLLNKEISLQREIACDNFVINTSGNSNTYLNAIYKIATISVKPTPVFKSLPWALGILNLPNELLYRVKSMTNTKRFNSLNATKMMLVTLMACVMIWLPFKKPTLHNNITLNPKSSSIVNRESKWVATKPLALPTKTSTIYTSIHKHKHQLEKHHQSSVVMLSPNELDRNKNLLNTSYEQMVQKTLGWLQSRVVENQFASFTEKDEEAEMEVAEKILMRAIYTNYQLKREILNDLLAKSQDQKEAMDFILNSKQWEQMQQFEKWTSEFLKKHPTKEDTPMDRVIVY